MSNNAIDIINLLCQKFGIVIDWTDKNLLPYIQQLFDEIAHGRYSLNLAAAILSFSIVIFCSLLVLWLERHSDEHVRWAKDGYKVPRILIDSDEVGVLKIFCYIFIGVGIIVGIACTMYAIQWKTMPITSSYEWLMNLINRR